MDTKEQRIEREAREMFPDPNLTASPLIYGKRIGYKIGATKEAARNKEDAVALVRWFRKSTGLTWKTSEQLYDLFVEQNKKV